MSTKPDHKPQGDPCTRCACPSRIHRVRRARNVVYDRRYNHEHPRVNPSERIIGIDGEGQGRRPHKYFYVAASDEHGKLWTLEPANGESLSAVEVLDFICDLPERSLIFGYAFVYDLTKILQDLPDRTLYRLFHEGTRAHVIRLSSGKVRLTYSPVYYKNFKLNYMNRRLTVERRDGRRATVWDIFRFFARKFTESLIDWGVAAKERLVEMAAMKEKRKIFDQLPRKVVQDYCNEEVDYLAKLGRQLLGAHEDVDLNLAGQYYGAGSTASALLKKMDVLSYRGEYPPEMQRALACAFFGGRFEHSWVGAVKGAVYNYDISSAYPYAATLLPCLNCGTWTHVTERKQFERRIKVSSLALLRWSIGPILRDAAWGVFPVRAKDGTITFPLAGQGGWTWKEEFLAARTLNPHVEITEGWFYDTDCEHRPFGMLPGIYRERCRIGKDAKGLVLKLGPNSVYGKVAQSKGLNPPFQSWIWAGNITSRCRAQLLDSLSRVKDPWNILAFATDGVWSREQLDMPAPVDTGTFDVVDKKDGLKKPLGGWEAKTFDRGVFLVRPGIYFPLQPTTEEIEKVRARGLGRRVLYENWQAIVEAYEAGKKEISVVGVERFIGAKSGVRWDGQRKYTRSDDYGEWVPWETKVTFNPAPKRKSVLSDGRLEPWGRMPESVPYSNAIESPEARLLKEAEQYAEEQPDTDWSYQDFDDVGL